MITLDRIRLIGSLRFFIKINIKLFYIVNANEKQKGLIFILLLLGCQI